MGCSLQARSAQPVPVGAVAAVRSPPDSILWGRAAWPDASAGALPAAECCHRADRAGERHGGHSVGHFPTLDPAREAGVPAGWVTADEVYGNSPALRGWLEPCSCPMCWPSSAPSRWVAVWAAGVGGQAGRPRSAGGLAVHQRRPGRQGPPTALLVSVGDPGHAGLCIPGGGRGHRARPPPSTVGLIPLTCNEIQHLFAALVAAPVAATGRRLHWSWCRPAPVGAAGRWRHRSGTGGGR
jgi:hypothetical protein